jgi:hypothetical protein
LDLSHNEYEFNATTLQPLAKFSNLHCLSLAHSKNISRDVFIPLAELHPKLVALNLNCCSNLPPESINDLATLFPSLTNLHLSCFSGLSTALGGLSKLRELDLSACQLPSDIDSILVRLGTIEVLNLDKSDISPSAAFGITSMYRLRKLSLVECRKLNHKAVETLKKMLPMGVHLLVSENLEVIA